MKRKIVFSLGLMMLCVLLWSNFVQSFPAVKAAKLAPPINVRVEAGENAIKVMWDAGSDESDYNQAGYNVYFDTKSLILRPPDHLPNEVQVGKRVHTCVIRGLENGRQYFFQVRARDLVGRISAASLAEKDGVPQLGGKNYSVSMYDDDEVTNNNSGYGWSRDNGQGLPGHRNLTQHGKDVDILMMESPAAKSKSIFISPSEADFTSRCPLRNKTLIVDIGEKWIVADSLSELTFATTAEIKKGHIYVLKTHDSYYAKLRIESIEAVTLLPRLGAQHSNTNLNKITFTYVSQLGQSYEDFLTGKPAVASADR